MSDTSLGIQISQFSIPMLTMVSIGIRLWHRIYCQWQASSISEGYFHKLVLPNLWLTDKPLLAKSTTYRNFDILGMKTLISMKK